jgi:hypothetical protein
LTQLAATSLTQAVTISKCLSPIMMIVNEVELHPVIHDEK